MWVQLKLKREVFNCSKKGCRERINLFTYCDANENFIFMSKYNMKAGPQMKYEFVVKRKGRTHLVLACPKKIKV